MSRGPPRTSSRCTRAPRRCSRCGAGWSTPARARILELCAVTDGGGVLEVGAGSQLVALAAANPSGATCDLPLDDDSCDVVVGSYVLDILAWEDIRRAVTEFRRVLRPGGRPVLCHVTPGERRRHGIGDHLYGSGLPLTGNCRGIRLAAVTAEHGFEQVTPRVLHAVLAAQRDRHRTSSKLPLSARAGDVNAHAEHAVGDARGPHGLAD
jgi:SAM-dependent methyltransferase